MPAQVLMATFTAYNQAIWPIQVVLVALALTLVLVALRGRRGSLRVFYLGASLLWAWCGAVFFIAFYGRYAAVPTVPYVFGAAFLVQAVLFGRAALVARDGIVALRADRGGVVGGTLIAFALLVYPLLASALGQHYPVQPTFGAPCPVTVFTLGMLLLVTGRVPAHLLPIPFVWALLGVFPVVRAGIYEDVGMILAGLVALPLILAHNRRLRAVPGKPTTPGVGETPAPMEGTRRLH